MCVTLFFSLSIRNIVELLSIFLHFHFVIFLVTRGVTLPVDQIGKTREWTDNDGEIMARNAIWT